MANASNPDDVLHESSTGHPFSEAGWLDTHFEACSPEYKVAFRMADIQPGWRVLDAGCGSGSYVPWIADAVGAGGHVTALDLDPNNVAVVRRRADEEWNAPCPINALTGSVTDLPYPDDCFDAIWCANTTQYLADDDLRVTLHEFRRVVQPGGVVAIKEVDPHHYVLQPAIPGLFWRHWLTAIELPHFNPVKSFFRVWNLPMFLTEAGIEPLHHRASIIERRAPLRPVEQTYLKNYLAGTAEIAVKLKADILPEADLAVWRGLLDPNESDHLVDHPNFYWCEGQAVSVGRIPSAGGSE